MKVQWQRLREPSLSPSPSFSPLISVFRPARPRFRDDQRERMLRAQVYHPFRIFSSKYKRRDNSSAVCARMCQSRWHVANLKRESTCVFEIFAVFEILARTGNATRFTSSNYLARCYCCGLNPLRRDDISQTLCTLAGQMRARCWSQIWFNLVVLSLWKLWLNFTGLRTSLFSQYCLNTLFSQNAADDPMRELIYIILFIVLYLFIFYIIIRIKVLPIGLLTAASKQECSSRIGIECTADVIESPCILFLFFPNVNLGAYDLRVR